MNIILLDSDDKVLESLQKNINELLPYANVTCFNNARLVQEFVKCNKADVLISDVHLQNTLTISLVRNLRKNNPKLNVIFNTEDESFKGEALDLRVSGYMVKPATKQKLKKELDDLRYSIEEENSFLRVQCFGNFSVFSSKGDVFKFTRSKEKELLAYLVYKCGSEVNLKELGAILFEDQMYDAKQQSYLQQLLFCLNKDLKKYNCENLLVRSYNSISINTDYVDCDYYRFNSNEQQAKRMYNGEFMNQYEWADYVVGYLDSKSL